VIGSPAFSRVTLALPGGNRFVIKSVDNGEKQVYIESARLNGRSYTKPYLNHGNIVAGGIVEFRMSDRPQGDFGRMKETRPFSMSEETRR
jgi:putative alpha-1,2-mannosidase